jgi:hypothetical protein
VRCSADHACTSVVGAAQNVGVISGEGGDVALGAWGSPFDPGAGVGYDRVARTTTLSWWLPDARPADIYRGLLGPGITRGSYIAPFWRLDTTGAAGSAAACLRNDVAGTPEVAAPAGPGGTSSTSGPLDQSSDPDPPLGSGVYYVVAADAPGSGSTNAMGCARPSVCSRRGWCQSGTNAGAPCDADADCPGGGACATLMTSCRTTAGRGGAGGCGRYGVCGGGANAGLLCTMSWQCPGSECALPAATTTSPGSICLVSSTPPGSLVPGTVVSECPAPGDTGRVVRTVPPDGLCP